VAECLSGLPDELVVEIPGRISIELINVDEILRKMPQKTSTFMLPPGLYRIKTSITYQSRLPIPSITIYIIANRILLVNKVKYNYWYHFRFSSIVYSKKALITTLSPSGKL
jgi:hypothetical protein